MTTSRRALTLVASGVLLVLLLAAVFREPLLESLVVLALRQSLGLHATISQVEGNVVAGLDLRGLNMLGEAGVGSIASFEAERISARYALSALLRGKEAFLDSLDVTVEGARIDLDLTAPPVAGSKPGEQPAGLSAFPRLPRLTVRDSRVRVRGQGFTLEVDGLQGAVARADQAHEQVVDVRADRLSLRHPALQEGTLSLSLTGRYAPQYLAITAAQVNGEPLVDRARLDLGERPGDLDLQLALKLWQGSIEFGMLRRTAATEVRWDARGVDLQPQRILVNPALGALRGLLSTNGEVRLGGGGISTLAGKLSLDWKGALLAGRAVDHLVIEGSAEPGAVLLERAQGRIGPNEITLHQVSLPAGPLFEGRWRALLSAASGTFSATLGDVPAFLALWGVSADIGAAAIPNHSLRLEGSMEKGTLRLARGDLATGLGKATLDAVTVTFPREDQGWGETGFSGGATIDIPNLKDVSALFPIPSLSGSLRGEISGMGTFAKPEGRASLTGRGVGVAGKTLGDVELQAHGTAGGIEIDSLQVRQGDNRFTAQDVRFDPTALAAPDLGAFLDSLAGSFTLNSTDLPGLTALAGIPPELAARTPAAHLLKVSGVVKGKSITITAGSFTAVGSSIALRAARIGLPAPGADWKKDMTFEGDLEVGVPDLGPIATIFRLPPLQGTLKGRARISGSMGTPGGSVEASGRGIVIDGHRVGDVSVKAALQQQRLTIEALELTRGKDLLRGKGSFDLETETVLEADADLALADVAPYLAEFGRGGIPVSGRLHIGLRTAGPVPGAPLAVEAGLSEGRIGDMRGVQGTARALISLQGTLRQPRVSVTSLASELRGDVEGRPIRASLNAAYEPGQARIGAFELIGSGGLAVKGEGTIPVDLAADEILSPGPVSLRVQATIPALEELAFLFPPAYAIKGALRADVGVTGSWKEPEARLEISGERLQLPPGTRFVPPGASTLAGTLTWGKAEARAEKMRLESPALAFSLSGAWSSPPSLSSLVAGTGATTGSLSIRTTFTSPDIGWLRGSFEGLRRLSGSVAGEIAVDGPAGDPALSGEIRVADGAFRYQDLLPIDSLTARAAVARRRVTLETFSGNVGGSPFTLAGSLDFSRLDDPVLDLRLQGKNALLYRDEGLRVRADSDLTLRGPVSALSLTGEVALTNSLYQKDITVASLFSGGNKTSKRATPGLAGISFPEPPLRDMRFDVRLIAREPFQIRTTVVRGAARPDMRLTGTGLLPILRGPILVDTAQVLLPSGTLEVEHGTVLYRESDPDRPALDFGGRMQSRGYEITAQIGGTLDSPEVILSSIPPLPREELLLFVLTGAPPESGGTGGDSVTAKASPMAVYLGKNVLGQLLGGGSKAGFQDRIELQIGREMTRSGSVTVDARLLLRKNPIAHGSSLYLTSDKDIYDQYNAGLKILFKFK